MITCVTGGGADALATVSQHRAWVRICVTTGMMPSHKCMLGDKPTLGATKKLADKVGK